MDLNVIYQIAEELAAGETRPAVLFKTRGLTPEQAAALLESQEFQQIAANAQAFRANRNRLDYLRERARAAVLRTIDDMASIVRSEDIDPKARVAAAKLLSELADVGPKPQATGGGATASIVIQFADSKTTIDAAAFRQPLPASQEPDDEENRV